MGFLTMIADNKIRLFLIVLVFYFVFNTFTHKHFLKRLMVQLIQNLKILLLFNNNVELYWAS
jgi:hypothetical protein